MYLQSNKHFCQASQKNIAFDVAEMSVNVKIMLLVHYHHIRLKTFISSLLGCKKNGNDMLIKYVVAQFKMS